MPRPASRRSASRRTTPPSPNVSTRSAPSRRSSTSPGWQPDPVSDLTYLDSVVLGVVEGLTEFLPVSSTGHLTVAEKLLGQQADNPAVTAFTAIIQLGAIVATFIYFRRDIVRLVGAWVRGLVSAPARRDPDYRIAWYVIAGSLPVAVVGFLAKDLIKGPLRSLWVVSAALILWSGVMYVAEGRGRQKYEEGELTLRAALT